MNKFISDFKFLLLLAVMVLGGNVSVWGETPTIKLKKGDTQVASWSGSTYSSTIAVEIGTYKLTISEGYVIDGYTINFKSTQYSVGKLGTKVTWTHMALNGTVTTGGTTSTAFGVVTSYPTGSKTESTNKDITIAGAKGEITSITVKYSPISYYVAFDGNGSTSGSMSNQSFVYDAVQNLKSNTFVKNYTVTFNVDGGSAVANQTSSAPFQGWATSEGGSVVYNNGQPVSNLATTNNATVTLYAKWGNFSAITLPNSTKSGYVLEGWYDGVNMVGEAGGSYVPSGNVTLKAIWTQRYDFEMSGANHSMYVDDTQTSAFTFGHADGPVAHISDPAIISYNASTNTITALKAGTATIYFTQSQTETINEGTSATYTYTVSKIANTLDASISATALNPDGTATISLRGTQNNVGTVVTYSVKTQTLAIGNSVLNPGDGVNVVTNSSSTFTAKNAGTATVTVSQAETYKYTAFSKDFNITVSKIANSLSVPSALDMKVDEERTPIYSSKNSDAAVTTTSTAPSVATFDPATNKLTAHEAGSATVTVLQAETYKYMAANQSINVSISKYTPVVTWKQTAATWNEQIANPYSIKVGGTSLDATSFTAQDRALADLVGGNIQTYHTNGTAHFLLVRDADRKYNAVSETLNLVISSTSENCDLLNEPAERSLFTIKEGPALALTGNSLPDELIFDAKFPDKDNWLAANNFFVEYSTDNGANWIVLANPDLSTDYKTYRYDLSLYPTITHIRFLTKTGATFTKYYKNIRVTRKLYLTPSTTSISMPTIVKDAASFETFNVSWSTCSASGVHLHSTNGKFQISLDGENFYDDIDLTPEGAKTYGEATITVRYTSSVLTGATPDVGQIEIYNQSRQATVDLSGMTAVEANLVWDQNFIYESEENGTFSTTEMLVTHIEDDAHNDITSNYTITYSLEDGSFASISGTTLNVTGTGRTRIVCTAMPKPAYAGSYATIVESKTLFVHVYGTDCNSDLLDKPSQFSLGAYSGAMDYVLADGPADMLTFKAWKVTAATQRIRVAIYDEEGNELKQVDYNVSSLGTSKPATPNASIDMKTLGGAPYRLHFSGTGSLDKYVSDVVVTQQSYLRTSPSVSAINEEVKIGDDFSMDITVAYSDIPSMQYAITNTSGANLSFEPKLGDAPSMSCGDYGMFTFTLSGSWETPANYTETITITNTLGNTINIPVTISVVNGDIYYLTPGGDWSTVESWHLNAADGPVATALPEISNQVVIVAPTTVDEGVNSYAYSLKIMNTGSLIVEPTAGLTVGAGGITDEDGNAITDPTKITMLANNDGQTGYLRISPDAAVAQPYATAQLFTKSFYSNHARWQYIGSPVTESTVDNAQDMFYKCFLYGWDETNTSSVWASTGNYHKMQPFHGYATTTKLADYEHGHTIVYQGQINPTVSQLCPVTYTDGQATDDKGWNLLANSWTAPIDVTKFVAADFPDGADMTLYVYNTGSSIEASAESGVNRATITRYGDEAGQYTTIAALAAGYLDLQEQKVIPAMQGFFYVSNQNGNVKLDYRRLVWEADYATRPNRPLRAPGRVRAEEQSGEKGLTDKERELSARVFIHLMAKNDSSADHLYLLEKEDWTADYDNGYDARKVLQNGLTSIFTSETAGRMAISATDNVEDTYIGIQTGADSVYVLRFAHLIGTESLYVQDMENDSIFAITAESAYTFHAQPNTLNDIRFRIIAGDASYEQPMNPGVTTGWDMVSGNEQFWMNEQTLFMTGNGMFCLYDAAGRMVISRQVNNTATLNLQTLPVGVYMARLGNTTYKIIR